MYKNKHFTCLVNKNMVFYTDTFEICHKLSKKGETAYRKMLEQEADKILFKHEHPIKWFFQKIISFFER